MSAVNTGYWILNTEYWLRGNDPVGPVARDGGGRIIDGVVDDLAHAVEPKRGASEASLAASHGRAHGFVRKSQFKLIIFYFHMRPVSGTP
jgi:hypothetical protein